MRLFILKAPRASFDEICELAVLAESGGEAIKLAAKYVLAQKHKDTWHNDWAKGNVEWTEREIDKSGVVMEHFIAG